MYTSRRIKIITNFHKIIYKTTKKKFFFAEYKTSGIELGLS